MPPTSKTKLRTQHQALRPRSSVGLTTSIAAAVSALGANNVASYHPLPTEPDVSEFNREFARAGNLLLPRIVGQELEFAYGELVPGSLGIMEPIGESFPLDAIELFLVPALAVDRLGNRLGKGRGYYDRVLKRSVAKALAVVFDGEIVELIEAQEHDVRMQYVVTPTQFMHFE
jgi:5-formyltetrahydrofolate cyclo-ligase